MKTFFKIELQFSKRDNISTKDVKILKKSNEKKEM